MCWFYRYPVADSEGGSRLRPLPPLGDGLMPSLTALLTCDSGTVLWRHCRHFYLFKHVKHGTLNIQNGCHQWLYDSFRAHQIRFRPGLLPGPTGGAYSAPPDPLTGLASLRGPTSKGKGREGDGKGEGKGKERERREEREGTVPPFANSWIRVRYRSFKYSKLWCHELGHT